MATARQARRVEQQNLPTMQAVRAVEPVELAAPAREDRKVFKIIQRDTTKKTQKQLYARELAVPVDSKLVQAQGTAEAEAEEERMELKRRIMAYEAAQREEEREDLIGSGKGKGRGGSKGGSV